ncbi:MAG: hypothetical protein HDR01_04085 [Lachnospiraceae bacterium]|nr:hypothetical protein [Lachnospiraceae bacterium]
MGEPRWFPFLAKEDAELFRRRSFLPKSLNGIQGTAIMGTYFAENKGKKDEEEYG